MTHNKLINIDFETLDFYIYKATVDSIYDGDTIRCTIDCGFGVNLNNQKIRLYGINTPEIRGIEKEKGKISRDALKNKIDNKEIILKTIKDKKGKYGRFLAILYIKEDNKCINVNQWLVENNYAKYIIY